MQWNHKNDKNKRQRRKDTHDNKCVFITELTCFNEFYLKEKEEKKVHIDDDDMR